MKIPTHFGLKLLFRSVKSATWLLRMALAYYVSKMDYFASHSWAHKHTKKSWAHKGRTIDPGFFVKSRCYWGLREVWSSQSAPSLRPPSSFPSSPSSTFCIVHPELFLTGRCLLSACYPSLRRSWSYLLCPIGLQWIFSFLQIVSFLAFHHFFPRLKYIIMKATIKLYCNMAENHLHDIILKVKFFSKGHLNCLAAWEDKDRFSWIEEGI